MLLSKWAKNFDGTPGAMAPLVVTGYCDIDAREGRVQTDARNTSRFTRSFLLSASALCNWNGWPADVATAFLQGLPHERHLWVKLPADALAIRGAGSECMLLMKSLCDQVDAARRWFPEHPSTSVTSTSPTLHGPVSLHAV